jgi:hypothetical protein
MTDKEDELALFDLHIHVAESGFVSTVYLADVPH